MTAPPSQPEPGSRIDIPSPYAALDALEFDHRRHGRRIWLPVILFMATCISTFFVGAMSWVPLRSYPPLDVVRTSSPRSASTADVASRVAVEVIRNWRQGATYMGALLAILLTHEMGHFLMAVRYRIPASLPMFIPIPISAVGTLGAVIGLDGLRADRRQMFDLGIAGPLAGLVVAIPILCLGVFGLEPSQSPIGLRLHNPLLIRLLIDHFRPDLVSAPVYESVDLADLNPWFMAGWVGLLITGLNMLPISQLDGGHVVYTLFGRSAHFLARGFLVLAILAVITCENLLPWTPMIVLVTFIGTDHPPTKDDRVRLGSVRWLIGLASLAIPIYCFPLWGISLG